MKRTLNLALVTALLVSAPGPMANRAIAAVVTGVQVQGAGQVLPTVSVVPSLQLGQGLSAPLTQLAVGSLTPNLPSVALGSLSQTQAVALPGIQAAPVAKALSQVKAAPTVAAQVSALSAKGEQLRSKDGRPMAAAIGSLQTGAQNLGKEDSSGGRSAVLSTLFHGSRRSGIGETPAVVGSDTSGRASALSSGADLGGLETVAKDSAKPQQSRVDAVAAIAKQGDAAAKDALIRVSEANPQGGAADYEVHRAALKALAETFNDIRSLRPVTQAHADQILAKLAADKPEMAIFDYDDTLEALNTPLSRETAEALKAAADAGVETAILTDRPDTKRDEKDKGITVVESLQTMTPAERAAISLVSSRGTRTLLFKGEQTVPVLVKEENIFWTEQQKEVILAAGKAVEKRYGRQEYNGKTEELSTYSYSKIMPIGMNSTQIKEAAAFMQAELLKGGVDVQVVGRLARRETDPPYISVSKIDKSIGVLALRSSRNALAQMRDALRFGLPVKWAKAAYSLLGKLPSRTVSPQKMVVVGDQFFDAHVADYGFVKGAPGALAISVGGKADPRLQNIFVWPTQGRVGSTAVLQAMGKKVPSEMDKKAVVGLFAQRTVSIGVFILTSIAYPFIAVPVVGWAGYGALMAFGPLAAIATGPLNGLLVDKLSARNAMSINTLVRVALNLVLPIFSLLGVLNFWTLLIASIANGWLLSSVMTTENAYIKRLAGAKNVGTVNNLLWINYLFIQVFLSLILGIGSIVDTTGPLFAFYASAGLHLAVVLPIIWFTMPKLSTAPNSIPGMLGRIAKNEAAIAKGVKNAAELTAANAQLAKDVAARQAALARQIPELKAAIAKSQAELAAVQAQKPAGIKAWLSRFSTIMALKADINLRQKAAAAAEKELANEKTTLKSALQGLVRFLKNNAAPIAAFAGSVGIYLAYNTTLPIIGALIYWITTTDGFKALWFGKGSEVAPEQKELEDKIAANEKAIQEGKGDAGALREENKKLGKEAAKWQNRLRNVMLYLAMTAIFLYPLQGFGLPQIASALVGASAKGVLYGQLLGSLFFGNLIANAARAKLPEIRIPLLGRLPAERLIQGLVAGLAATWVATTLVPGSILAAAAAVAAAIGLMALARKFTDKAWLQFIGLGFSAIWIPYLAWGGVLSFIPVKVALMLALLAMGMFYGPAYVALQSYFQKHAAQKQMGKLIGVQGSMFNAATSLGYALMAAAAGLFIPSFPPLLAVLGAAYFIGGLIFLRSGKVLPGLPKTLTTPKQ